MNKKRTTTLWAMIGLMGLSGTPSAETDLRLLQTDLAHKSAMADWLSAPQFSHSDHITTGQLNVDLLQSTQVGDQLQLPSALKQRPLTLFVESKAEHIPGVSTLTGSIDGHWASNFVMSFAQGRLVAKLQLEHDVFVLEPVPTDSSGTHVMHRPNLTPKMGIYEPDVMHLEDYPQQLQEAIAQRAQLDEKWSTEKSTQSTTNDVKVLFLYANNVPNANLQAANVVGEFNKILERSAVSSNNRISAVGPAQVLGYDFQGQNRNDIIRHMTDHEYEFSDIELRRGRVGADVVFLFIKTDLSIRRVGGVANAFVPTAPYGLSTDTWALGDYTAIHELGHIFGGLHQDSNAIISALDDEDRNHGIEGRNRWLTIMGEYTDTCPLDYDLPAEKQICRRLPYFSNPDLRPPRITWGEPIGNPQTADMKSVLEYTMGLAANWGQFNPGSTYFEPVRGYSFDTKRNGHGIHISTSGSGPNQQYVVYFYTYDQAGNPEWMMAQTTFSNQRLTGTFNRIRLINNQPQFQPAGTFTIDYDLDLVDSTATCDGVNRSKQPGVFSWTIDQQSGIWCLQPVYHNENNGFPHATSPDKKSGLWFEPASAGWGFSYQSYKEPNSGSVNKRNTLSTVYYYDSLGIGRWANAQHTFFTNEVTPMRYEELWHVDGYARTDSVPSIQLTDIGRLELRFSNSSSDRVTLQAAYPNHPFGQWNRSNVVIDRLSH